MRRAPGYCSRKMARFISCKPYLQQLVHHLDRARRPSMSPGIVGTQLAGCLDPGELIPASEEARAASFLCLSSRAPGALQHPGPQSGKNPMTKDYYDP